MAITIRTGSNGSYKSAYTAYFVIFEALKAGKVVVTNIEGMQPLHEIEKRFDMKFPSTSKLFRISSRDEAGVFLWTYFFCWCPIGAQIVIDECQDIYSKNIGFDMKKIKYRPLSDFITKEENDGLLPKSYEEFFYSRYVPMKMDDLKESEVDDRGIAEYDADGRIIYPRTFNEGFMRHRKYNWDIELLSPDWKQIDTGIKACGEQNFYHKGRDQFFWAKRKPFIWKHDKAVSTPVVPKGRDVNITKKKIPLEAFLLYKSTSTGAHQTAGAMNTLIRSPKVFAVFFIFILCMGYLVHDLSGRFFGSSEEVQTVVEENAVSDSPSGQTESQTQKGSNVSPDVSSGGSGGQVSLGGGVVNSSIADVLPFDGIQKAYVTGINFALKGAKSTIDVSIEINAADGVYSLNQDFLKAFDVNYEILGDCLLRLKRADFQKMITCKPVSQLAAERDITASQISELRDMGEISLF